MAELHYSREAIVKICGSHRYGVILIVWWRAFGKDTLTKQLERVQRAALFGFFDALNAVLHIVPVDIAGMYIAAQVAIRIRETDPLLTEANKVSGYRQTSSDWVPIFKYLRWC